MTTTRSHDPLLASPPWVVLRATGEVDMDTASVLRASLQNAARNPARHVVVDLSGITFMDCAGLRPLLEARTGLRDRLWLTAPAPAVLLLLTRTGMLDAFKIVDADNSSGADARPESSGFATTDRDARSTVAGG